MMSADPPLSTLLLLLSLIVVGTAPAEDRYGIVGQTAPEFPSDLTWISAEGTPAERPIKLADYQGKVIVLEYFQSWCPGCYKLGFPAIQEIKEALADEPLVVSLAVQTVFEGHHINTKEKIRETQKQFGLSIPFGHDPGTKASGGRSQLMHLYRTGGTPWNVVINDQGVVVANGFHIDPELAIPFLRELAEEARSNHS
ncbi:MAG: TlpA disulfide reductase family protein [Verrucomicrobiota bacterium]